jgi:hypothetical protein
MQWRSWRFRSVIFYHTSPVIRVISKKLSMLQEDSLEFITNSVDQNHSASCKIQHGLVFHLAYILVTGPELLITTRSNDFFLPCLSLLHAVITLSTLCCGFWSLEVSKYWTSVLCALTCTSMTKERYIIVRDHSEPIFTFPVKPFASSSRGL